MVPQIIRDDLNPTYPLYHSEARPYEPERLPLAIGRRILEVAAQPGADVPVQVLQLMADALEPVGLLSGGVIRVHGKRLPGTARARSSFRTMRLEVDGRKVRLVSGGRVSRHSVLIYVHELMHFRKTDMGMPTRGTAAAYLYECATHLLAERLTPQLLRDLDADLVSERLYWRRFVRNYDAAGLAALLAWAREHGLRRDATFWTDLADRQQLSDADAAVGDLVGFTLARIPAGTSFTDPEFHARLLPGRDPSARPVAVVLAAFTDLLARSIRPPKEQDVRFLEGLAAALRAQAPARTLRAAYQTFLLGKVT